jgi:ABC-type branched-subunit amino acid transport system ATPase component
VAFAATFGKGRRMTAVLEVRDVGHAFNGLRVLRGVSFAVPTGRITGLIGPNGAGKSTLFNIISGFLAPDAGDIVFEGRSMTGRSVQQRSRAGLVRSFQTPQVFRHMTVRDNLIAGAHKLGSSGVLAGLLRLPTACRDMSVARQRADESCTAFALSAVRDQLAGKLPAGQQRLVELARAALTKPALLCLDEPSSGLNAEEVERLMTAIRRLNAESISILLVSHDMHLVSLAERIHVLCFGEIIASGSFAEVKVDPRVRDAYLGG